jgi:hypothetical protein
MPDPIIVNLSIDPETLAITGKVTIPPQPIAPPAPGPTQRGWDAVADLGLDPTGQLCCTDLLLEWIDALDGQRTELHFPPGRYYFSSTLETNAKGLKFIGDGALSNMSDSSVVFCSDQPRAAMFWFNCTTTGSNMEGPHIQNIQFQDSSPEHNQLGCAIRITNTANSELNVGFLNMVPRRYTNGTVTVTTNSDTVYGQDVSWTPDMVPGWIVIDGYPYEIVDVPADDMLTLAISYQGPSAAGKGYAVNSGGIGVWCEPGLGFTQYGKSWSLNGRIGCALFASSGTTIGSFTGTSRIKVLAGYLNGVGIPDSIAGYFGPYSDTFRWDVAMNSYAFGLVIANGHQHDLMHGDYENAGGPPPVTGLPTEYNSCHGILVMSDNSSDTWGNRLGGYFRQVGTAIELYGQPGKAPNYTVIGVATFRSCKATVVNGNATNTQGASVYAAGYSDSA